MKKPEQTNNNNEKEYMKVDAFEVANARMAGQKNTVYFTLTLNGVRIYNCRVVEYDKGDDFIGFPQQKGSNGEYYPVVTAYVSPDDTKKILEEVEKQLNS